jgi:hypothetical protein
MMNYKPITEMYEQIARHYEIADPPVLLIEPSEAPLEFDAMFFTPQDPYVGGLSLAPAQIGRLNKYQDSYRILLILHPLLNLREHIPYLLCHELAHYVDSVKLGTEQDALINRLHDAWVQNPVGDYSQLPWEKNANIRAVHALRNLGMIIPARFRPLLQKAPMTGEELMAATLKYQYLTESAPA